VLAKAEAQGALTPELANLKAALLKPNAVTDSTSHTSGQKTDLAEQGSLEISKASPDKLAKIGFDRMGGGDLEGAAAALSAPQLATVSANITLRAAFYELRLQRAISTARSRNCVAVGDQMARLNTPDPSLPYTRPGGSDYLETPRTLFYIGRTYGLCSASKQALAYWKQAAAKKVDADSAEAVFPVLARVQLAAYDEKPAVQEARERLKAATPEAKAAAQYQVGILLQALGKLSDSDDHLEQAQAGTGPVHYWANIGLRDNDLARQGVR
jgi:tetratricopeptide (TPR) repeat protein